MLKGVNKLIIEVKNPESDFFDRAIFFVKPEKSNVVTKEISQSAQDIMGKAGKIEPQKANRHKKSRLLLSLAKFAGAAGVGALIMGLAARGVG